MTDDNAKNKLTLSGKSTLTLRGVSDKSKSTASDGKKFVQVEVRKKRVINPAAVQASPKVEIDEATAEKLRLIAEAKEHEAKRRQEEEEKEKIRQQQREAAEKEKQAQEAAQKEAEEKAAAAQREAEAAKAKAAAAVKEESAVEDRSSKIIDKKVKDYDDDDEDDDDERGKKFRKSSGGERQLSREETFEQERKKVMKRSFETPRRGGKISIHSISDDDDDDYGFGGPRRRFKKKQPKPAAVQQPQEKVIKEVIIPEVITVQELANRMAEKSAEVVKKLMSLGVMATINQPIDADTAQIIVEEFGHKYKRVAESDVEQGLGGAEDTPDQLLPRAPVVTVMGHVDHGKTSLLDALRETNVAAKEAGGITQHIGAYQITVPTGDKITFIDTPGHEAFSEMRARGAKVTDIVVLVVAANDGIMPQTIEAIRHAQAADVPIVVAINKIDLPGADPMKVKTALLQHGIAIEEMGGQCLCAEVSAKKRINIDKLVEAILLQAEILDLKANPNRKAVGTIIESSLDRGRGYVATILVSNGTLHVGDIVLAGTNYGRVKALFNERDQRIDTVGPAEAATLLGLNGAPQAGDIFHVMDTEQEAREIALKREQLQREQALRAHSVLSLDEIGRRIARGGTKELNLIVKGDVDGSVEALSDSLEKLSTEKIKVNVILKSVGQISENDVSLAAASQAIIIGFQVRPSVLARKQADQQGVDIRLYSIIYDAIGEVKAAMEGMLEPVVKEEVTATVEVRQVFHISKVGFVAGAFVTDGKVSRSDKARLIRDGIVIQTANIAALKRFKDDVREVAANYECGISLQNCNDIKEGDIIETFKEVEVKAEL